MNSPGSTPAPERRNEERPRVSAEAKVECRRLSGGADANVALEALNVSRGGLRLTARGTLDPGEAVLVTLHPPGGAPLQRPGKVAWVLPLSSDSWFAGVAFETPLSAEELRQLAGPAD